MLKLALAALFVLAAAPLAAGAQTPAPKIPAYARAASDVTIRGRIVTAAPFHLTVHDDKGTIDDVTLHRGTIINPTGLTLATGMRVKIIGYAAGTTFAANEIDTPYTYSGPLPAPFYYGPGWWYPGFGYGYGPAFGFNVRIGPNPGFQRVPFPHNAPVGQPPNAPPPNRRMPMPSAPHG
ncbi:MAG: hypothetical protein ABSH03_03325 [Candidatus Lustribacter sp.]|jgi:hypothetical protein